MIFRFALKSLAVRPIKTVVLACGFGLGMAVMAVLLGIGEVILEQARSPALQGGGDVVVSGAFGPLESARFVLASVLGSSELKGRERVVSPSKRATLILVAPDGWTGPVAARGGIPSRERAIGDRELIDQPAWVDTAGDHGWTDPDPHGVLRSMDRFHAQPPSSDFASSWAEWLYFNGRTADGRTRFYLTFLAGPVSAGGMRTGGVRLQLDRDGHQTNYSAAAQVDERVVLDNAPDLDFGENHVRLDGLQYRIALRLKEERTGESLVGDLLLQALPGRSLPPVVMHGARNWMSGYVVPVLSGSFSGAVTIGREVLRLDGATGYHDHNWGFWQDVRWQWGQVARDDLSFIYGRVFPPASVADPDRVPGFLGVLGPDGPLAVSSDVSIDETDGDRGPEQIVVRGRGNHVDVALTITVDREVQTDFQMTKSSAGEVMKFLQLGGMYHVTGRVGDRTLDFSARGAAETFRHR
jgi:hypothetical protein